MGTKRSLLLLLAVLLLGGCAPKAPAFNVEEQLLLAEQAFLQGNYEETILKLEMVLEVEPNNAKGYLRLSDAYIAKGDRDKALEVLQKGLELTEDESIAQRIREITDMLAAPANTSAVVSSEASDWGVEDWVLGGISVLGGDIDALAEVLGAELRYQEEYFGLG